MTDILFTAEDRATLRTVVASDAFKAIIGDPVDPETGDLNLISGRYLHMDGVAGVYFPPGIVPVAPGVVDPRPWLHLRLHGMTERRDERTGAGQDRWNRSRLIEAVRNNAILRKLGDFPPWDQAPSASTVTIAVMTLPSGKRFGVIRGQEMAEAGLMFHEFLGGNAL